MQCGPHRLSVITYNVIWKHTKALLPRIISFWAGEAAPNRNCSLATMTGHDKHTYCIVFPHRVKDGLTDLYHVWGYSHFNQTFFVTFAKLVSHFSNIFPYYT